MGRFVPPQSFHLTISTTQHNVGEEPGIPAHVATVFTHSGSTAPLLPLIGPMKDGWEQLCHFYQPEMHNSEGGRGTELNPSKTQRENS